MSQDRAFIEGRRGVNIAVSATAAKSVPLEKGMYDVQCTVDCWIRVAKDGLAAPAAADNVTTTDGYPLKAGNTVAIDVEDGRCIGVIAGGAGTFNYHMTGR